MSEGQRNVGSSRTGPAGSTIAAIDIGSNSIKMTVARGTPRGPRDLDWRSETVRIGAGIDRTGRIADDRMEAALDTLQRFASIAHGWGAERIIAVATEAARIAENGPEFLRRATEETGIDIQAISGDREAELTFLGLDGVVDLAGQLVVADIGGGSTEVIVATDRQITWSQSLPLGSGRMTDKHVPSDPPTAEQLVAVEQHATQVLADAPLPTEASRLVIVGGTGEYLRRLLPPDPPVTLEAIDHVRERLTQLTSRQLADAVGLPVSRARVLPAGVAIADSIATIVSPPEVEVAQSGIRRGLLLAAFAGEL